MSEEQNWINTDGTFGQLDTAPEGVKDFVGKKNFSGIGDIIKSYNELEKFKGLQGYQPERVMVLPDKPEDVEGWNKVYNKLGKPESFDKYKFEGQFPEGITIPDEELAKVSEFAYTNNFSNKQFNAMIDFYNNLAKSGIDLQKQQEETSQAEIKRQRDAAWSELKKEYNIIEDKQMQDLVLKAKDTVDKLGLSEVLKDYEDNPQVIKAMIEVTKRASDSIFPDKKPVPEPDKNAKLKEIMEHPAFKDRMHPEHKDIMKKYHELFGIKY